MISDEQRSEEILKRFRNKEPLNLSAVEIECPWLLEGLFDAGNFKGWRESIELAGVPIGEIRIEPLTGVTCLECGFIGESLWSHLSHAHGMTAAEYKAAHPHAETSSEARRSDMMSNRHGRSAKAIIPHWEPAWSRNYALDRIHHFSRNGIPLNYGYVATHEPGFPAYVRRIFPSWDAGVAAAGLEVSAVRRVKEATSLTAEQVIEVLQEKEKAKPSSIHIRAARAGDTKTVITASFRHYGSYEKPLIAAGIDPVSKIPALKNKAKLKARDKLIEETMANLKNKPRYDPAKAKKFIDKHSATIKSFYGTWGNFATSLNLVERDLFNSPGHHIYDSKEGCIAGLQERARVGLSLRQGDVRTDNPSLELMGEKHFGGHSIALKAANVERLPHSFDQRTYANGDEVVASIRHRHTNGLSLYFNDVFREDQMLIKWAKRYFGSLASAIEAAGVPHPGVKPANRSRKPISSSGTGGEKRSAR